MVKTIPEIVQTLNSAMRDLNEALMPLFQMMRPVETVTVASQWVAVNTEKPAGVTTTTASGPVTDAGVPTTALPTAPKRKPGRPRKRVRPAPAQAGPPESATVSVGLTSPEEPVDVMMGPQADVIMAPQAPPGVVSPARQFQGKWMAATRKLSEADKVEARVLRASVGPEAALLWAQGRTAELRF